MRVGVRIKFDSAHYLERYRGKCKNLHGHSWVVEVEVEVEKLNQLGIGIDFRVLKKKIREVVDKLDHRLLNEIIKQPTAENLGLYIKKRLEEKRLRVASVRVWESSDTWIEV